MILATEERLKSWNTDKWSEELYKKQSSELVDILRYWLDGIAYIDVTPDQFTNPSEEFLTAWNDALNTLNGSDRYYIHRIEVGSLHSPTSTCLSVLTKNDNANDTLKNHLGDIKVLTPRALCYTYVE